MSQLQKVNEDQPNPEKKEPYKPQCELCQDQGFTGFPEAILPDGRTLIAIVLEKGKACTCSTWGGWFAEMQAKWFEDRQPCP